MAPRASRKASASDGASALWNELPDGILSWERKPMANPDKRTSFLRQLVGAARSIVTYQVGLPVGCIRISRVLFWLRPHKSLDYPAFEQYLLATRDLPISSERLLWNREALREQDQRLEAINQKFRDRVFDACYDIIQRYAAPDDGNDAAAPHTR
jgi:Protein of unknown function (DUF2489)